MYTITFNELKSIILEDNNESLPTDVKNFISTNIKKMSKGELSDQQVDSVTDGVVEIMSNKELAQKVGKMFGRAGSMVYRNIDANMFFKKNKENGMSLVDNLKSTFIYYFAGDEFEQAFRKAALTDPAFMVALIKVIVSRFTDKASLVFVCTKCSELAVKVNKKQKTTEKTA